MSQFTILGISREIFHVSDESDPTEPQKAIILVPVPRGTTKVFSALSSISWEFIDLKGHVTDHHLGDIRVTALVTGLDSESIATIEVTAFLNDRNFNQPWKASGTVELLFLGPSS